MLSVTTLPFGKFLQLQLLEEVALVVNEQVREQLTAHSLRDSLGTYIDTGFALL